MEDFVKATGRLDIILRKENGLVEVDTDHNLVVTAGRNHIANQLSAQDEAGMGYMAIGEGTVKEAPGDTTLGAEVAGTGRTGLVKAQGVGADAHKVVYTAEWAAGEGSGIITEAGIFNDPSAGVMLSRTTFDAKNKGPGDSLSIRWTLAIN